MSKVIAVTGASAGIGRAVADLFLDRGWTVALLARRAEPLELLAKSHQNALALPCDVTDEAAVAEAFVKIAERAGRLDVLFNNAGSFGPSGPIDEISLADWRAVLDVNLTGMFLCARAAFGQMRRQEPAGGRIINNGSISAHVPRPGSVCYTTTKHGVSGLTKTLNLDGRDLGICAGQLDIGNAATEMTKGIAQGARQADGSIKAEAVMNAVDVAEAVWYMANLPPEANVPSLTVMANKMPFIGRG
ncbi:SDR family oxidoreductase [Nioella aestuarii]|uniref:SDR family oxidoreductase n=1 Tax=Nioella aestuarii TaxID=1662864 RepID=UPI003D7FEB48